MNAGFKNKVILVIFPIGNGLSRFLSGLISDKFGRTKTMFILYLALSFIIGGFIFTGNNQILFVVLVFFASLFGGSPFAMFPALVGDYYGTKYSTTNYGITYSGKAWVGLVAGWLSGLMFMKYQTNTYISAFAHF